MVVAGQSDTCGTGREAHTSVYTVQTAANSADTRESELKTHEALISK